jgi:hypothetical protein
LYFLRTKDNTYLIQLRDVSDSLDKLPVQLALSGQLIKPIPRSRLLELGKRKQLVQLVPRAEGEEGEEADDQSDQGVFDAAAFVDEGSQSQSKKILDIGSFSQLQDAVARTGMVANVDLIAHVRDREFRCQNYPKAFQVIEGLFGKFSAAATQRETKLRQQDIDIASGKLKMSPKALMEKRARDVAESQQVDRARNRFLRVLEGLRVLMRGD